ncbi:MAG: hypothetical protein RIS58_944, partial [Actinomycetota bacterium]
MISHARRMSESDAFGEGTCDAYAGTAAHSATDGRAVVVQMSWMT